MKPRQYIDYNENQYYHGATKVRDLAGLLRKHNLFPHGIKGGEEHITANCVGMFQYLLWCESTKGRLRRDLKNYIELKNPNNGLFMDDFNKLFKNDFRSIKSIEVNMSSTWPMVKMRASDQLTDEKSILYTLKGDDKESTTPIRKVCHVTNAFIQMLHHDLLDWRSPSDDAHKWFFEDNPTRADIKAELDRWGEIDKE